MAESEVLHGIEADRAQLQGLLHGRVEIIDDPAEVARLVTPLCHKFTDDEDYIQKELKDSAKATLLLKLTPEHICGKLVNEA